MNWQIELMKALVEMVRTGGVYALWGIFIWFFMGILKISIIGGFIWAIIRLVVLAFSNFLTLKHLSHKDNINILSKKCSKHILDSIKDFQTTTTEAMLKFQKDATDLLKKSKQETQKTASKEN